MPISTSIKRMIRVSSQPPKYPDTPPTIIPIASGIRVASTAIKREILPPSHTRVQMSRPMLSVPNQCSAFGLWFRAE